MSIPTIARPSPTRVGISNALARRHRASSRQLTPAVGLSQGWNQEQKGPSEKSKPPNPAAKRLSSFPSGNSEPYMEQ